MIRRNFIPRNRTNGSGLTSTVLIITLQPADVATSFPNTNEAADRELETLARTTE